MDGVFERPAQGLTVKWGQNEDVSSRPTFCSLNAALNAGAAARNAVICPPLPDGHVIWPTTL